ncbi:hypothetical protein FB451DRAFT_1360706, partial [Mycena latifolia]
MTPMRVKNPGPEGNGFATVLSVIYARRPHVRAVRGRRGVLSPSRPSRAALGQVTNEMASLCPPVAPTDRTSALYEAAVAVFPLHDPPAQPQARFPTKRFRYALQTRLSCSPRPHGRPVRARSGTLLSSFSSTRALKPGPEGNRFVTDDRVEKKRGVNALSRTHAIRHVQCLWTSPSPRAALQGVLCVAEMVLGTTSARPPPRTQCLWSSPSPRAALQGVLDGQYAQGSPVEEYAGLCLALHVPRCVGAIASPDRLISSPQYDACPILYPSSFPPPASLHPLHPAALSNGELMTRSGDSRPSQVPASASTPRPDSAAPARFVGLGSAKRRRTAQPAYRPTPAVPPSISSLRLGPQSSPAPSSSSTCLRVGEAGDGGDGRDGDGDGHGMAMLTTKRAPNPQQTSPPDAVDLLAGAASTPSKRLSRSGLASLINSSLAPSSVGLASGCPG